MAIDFHKMGQRIKCLFIGHKWIIHQSMTGQLFVQRSVCWRCKKEKTVLKRKGTLR